MKNLQLRRAEHALDCVREMEKPDNKGAIEEYLSAVKALPAEIRMNGLGQAIAMLRARGNKNAGAQRLYQHVQGWMCGANAPGPYRAQKDLLEAVVRHPEHAYRLAYIEMDAYLSWLKRLADAILEPLKKKIGPRAAESS